MKSRKELVVVWGSLAAFAILGSAAGTQYLGAEHCTVHRTRLVPGLIPMRRGMLREIPKPWHLFPNANSIRTSGCDSTWTWPYAVVSYCPQCRKAEAAWLRTPRIRSGAQFVLYHRQWVAWRRTHSPTY
jgi:hypothetical protein